MGLGLEPEFIAPLDTVDSLREECDELQAEVERLKAKLAEPLHAMVDDGLPELLRTLILPLGRLEAGHTMYLHGALKAIRDIMELHVKHGVDCEQWT